MKLKKPKFWDSEKKNFFSILLSPLTLITQLINFLKKGKIKYRSSIKTICIGNIYVGGTGKTPLSIKINDILKKKYKTVFIKKKYSDQLDEQLLLSKNGELICKKNRKEALKEAEKRGFNIAIFDDGLQDKSISYDISIVCFNVSLGIGNGLLFPAGPLRENLKNINYYNLVFFNGYQRNDKLVNIIKKINSKVNIIEGSYVLKNSENFKKDKEYLAFSGIGNPINFENTLTKYSFNIKKKICFPDHYNYSSNDILKIKKEASDNNLEIITTEKDFLRLNEEQSKNIKYLEINLNINNENDFANYLLNKL